MKVVASAVRDALSSVGTELKGHKKIFAKSQDSWQQYS
jgi:hypothetical protein